MSREELIVEQLRSRENEDAVLCAFGPDYFHGARDGAFFGIFVSILAARRIFRSVRDQQHMVDRQKGILLKLDRGWFSSGWHVMSRGMRLQPFLTAGVAACCATATMKMLKYWSAAQRCNEFFVDDIEFLELKEMTAVNPQMEKAFHNYCDEVLHSPTTVAATLSTDVTHVSGSVALLLKRAEQSGPSTTAGGGKGEVIYRRPPTYWDGVAVGLFGSMMDCYLPQKPVKTYYRMMFGMGW